MNWIITKNNNKINSNDIPTISIEEIKTDFESFKMRLVGFFGKQEFSNVRLYVILADDKTGHFYVTSSLFLPEVMTLLLKNFRLFIFLKENFMKNLVLNRLDTLG